MIPPDGHDAEQAGRLVGKSKSWMYQQGAAGRIPRCKLGHHVWWTDAQIAEIKQSAEQPTKQPAPPEKVSEQRKKNAPAKKGQRRKSESSAAANTKIPQADFSVSRLYREGAA